MPSLHYPNSRFIFHPVRTPVSELGDADIVVVQRQCSAGNMQALKQMKDMGLKVIYDLDDDLWSIPGSSPAKAVFEPVKSGFGMCIEVCDLVTVSTEPLRTAVHLAVPKSRSKTIMVIPNGIDFDYLHRAPLPKPEGRVTLGWGGSNTHEGDVGLAWQVLPSLIEELPMLHLELIGSAPPKKLIGHPRVRTREFCPIGEYFSRYPSWGWDIAMAPLADVRFNRSKSSIKMVESAAIGIPCVASDVGPYRRFCDLDKRLEWLMCRTSQHWKEKIKALVLDKDLRDELAGVMRSVTEEHFEQRKLMTLWQQAFQEVLA
jgi:glycosyltransferase involved in cell wall biosynthesis